MRGWMGCGMWRRWARTRRPWAWAWRRVCKNLKKRRSVCVRIHTRCHFSRCRLLVTHARKSVKTGVESCIHSHRSQTPSEVLDVSRSPCAAGKLGDLLSLRYIQSASKMQPYFLPQFHLLYKDGSRWVTQRDSNMCKSVWSDSVRRIGVPPIHPEEQHIHFVTPSVHTLLRISACP